jgi:DNA-binding XRE family transcriptional regulator
LSRSFREWIAPLQSTLVYRSFSATLLAPQGDVCSACVVQMSVNPIDAAIGSKIRDLRLAASRQLSDIGRCVGLSDAEIADIEAGLCRPSAAQLLMIAEALGTTVHQLFETVLVVDKLQPTHTAEIIAFPTAKRG